MKKTAPLLLLAIALTATGVGGALALENIAYSSGRSDVAVAPLPSSSARVRYGFASTVTDGAISVSPDHPEDDAMIAYDFVRTGRGRLAIGPLLVLLVWALRSKKLLGRFEWWNTTLGGWVLGFSTTGLLYAGTSIAAGAAPTFNMICDAAVTAFAASGKWEALQDAIKGVKAKTPTTLASAALVLLVGGGLVMITGMMAIGCGGMQKGSGSQLAVSCLEGEGTSLIAGKAEAIYSSCGTGSGAEDCYEAQAETEGVKVGGCILANELAKILSGAKGFSGTSGAQDPAPMRSALDKFKARLAPGVVYQTSAGPL
jgi:hypothetical protein